MSAVRFTNATLVCPDGGVHAGELVVQEDMILKTPFVSSPSTARRAGAQDKLPAGGGSRKTYARLRFLDFARNQRLF